MRNLKAYVVFFILFVFYLVFCFFTYKDYGITGDEERNYKNGASWVAYFKSTTSVETLKNQLADERHSPLFDTHNRLYPVLLTLLNQKGYYEWYHLLNLLFGGLIFAAVYLAVYAQYKNSLYAVLAVVAFFTTPRLLGHLPANPKDMPFAVIYFVCLISIYKLSDKKGLFPVLLFGLLFGIAQSVRIVGLSLYIVYFLYSLFERKPLGKVILSLLTFFFVACGFMAITWPYMGSNFVKNFWELLVGAQEFNAWDNTILFNGSFLRKEQRPFLYLPVWFFITTPVYILVFSALSLKFLKKSKLLVLTWVALGVNFSLYFILRPVIYNGLRHFLFLLPLLVLSSLLFMFEASEKSRKNRAALFSVFVVCNVLLGINLYKLHPYEYLYFNNFIGGISGAHGKFALDYWGASYKEAAEWLKVRGYSKVYACNLSSAMLYYSEGKYEMASSSEEADYVVCDYDNDVKENPTGEVVYEVTKNGVPLNRVRLAP